MASSQRFGVPGPQQRSTRQKPGPRGTVFIRDVKVSNPQRVMDDSSRLTKLDIVRYSTHAIRVFDAFFTVRAHWFSAVATSSFRFFSRNPWRRVGCR
jgi:hypothetical protein